MSSISTPGAPMSAVMVAIGGYGEGYLKAALSPERAAWIRVVGCVDPTPERCGTIDEVRARNIPVYPSLAEFYAKHDAELAVISSPIHFHCPQTCEALEHGSHVLCEKPVAATVQEVRRMIEARDKARRTVAVGYQWSFSDGVQAVKADIRAGVFGKPRLAKTRAIVARNEAYYGRNNWAGAMKSAGGQWILDSPINNAVAHALHNMLYLLGPETDRAATPVEVAAELYRANAITNFDTGFMRVRTAEGPMVYFAATHAVSQDKGLLTVLEFENATVSWGFGHRAYKAVFRDGTVKDYPPNDDGHIERTRKLWETIGAIGAGRPVVCGLEAASAQNLALNGAQDSMPDIVDFPRAIVHLAGEPGKRVTYAEGLVEVALEAFEGCKLPSEMGVSWAKPGRTIDLRGYREFPGGGR